MAPPFRQAEFDIMFDGGISYEGDLVDLGMSVDVVEKSGAWLNYGKTRLGQGRENAKKFLIENKDLAEEIRKKIVEAQIAGKTLKFEPSKEDKDEGTPEA
jgi:recombination protein RecA